MSEFVGLLKLCVGCGTLLFILTLILMAMPQSKLRSVGLEMSRWMVVAGLAVLLVSPIDLIPLLPIDDVAYLIGGICTAKSALGERKRRACLEQLEFEQAASDATGKRAVSTSVAETEKNAA